MPHEKKTKTKHFTPSIKKYYQEGFQGLLSRILSMVFNISLRTWQPQIPLRHKWECVPNNHIWKCDNCLTPILTKTYALYTLLNVLPTKTKLLSRHIAGPSFFHDNVTGMCTVSVPFSGQEDMHSIDQWFKLFITIKIYLTKILLLHTINIPNLKVFSNLKLCSISNISLALKLKTT